MSQALQQLESLLPQIHEDRPQPNLAPVGDDRPEGKDHGRLSDQLTRLLFFILLTNTLVAVTITGFYLKREYIFLMESRIYAVADNVKVLLEDVLGLGLPLGSLDGVEKELEKTVLSDTQSIYANVTDNTGKVLYSFPKIEAGTVFYPDITVPLMNHGIRSVFQTGSSYNTFIPIRDPNQGKVVGGINIGVLKKTLYAQVFNSLATVIATFAGFIIITLLLLRIITRRSIKPLETLTHSAIELARGNFTTRVHIDVSNEIGSLARSFNYMAEQIEQDRKELTAHTAELEGKNEKLSVAHDELLERERNLKNAQSQLVLSEKMASLGVLIAGIAHEINTPAGAIANVASDLGVKVLQVVELLPEVQKLSDSELVTLQSFTSLFTHDVNIATTRTHWKQTRRFRDWLLENKVPNPKGTTEILSKYNLLDQEVIAPYLEILKLPWPVRLADALGTIHVGMEICGTSISKVSQIVKALKFYAYSDMEKTSQVDLNENIDNVLLLLHNKMKFSAEVNKHFSELPPVQCTSEISQVWTNLITNAYDAAVEAHAGEDTARIDITTELREGWVCVEITDNGTGIEERAQQKMFDPFFTTKDIGKGTGLGLSIVTGIIQKHQGKINVRSEPGNTTFTILLPIINTSEEGQHVQ